MRNGGDISSAEGPKGRYSLITSEDDGYAYLLIKHVQPKDAGGYHCFADFTLSPGQKTYTQLNVIGKYLENSKYKMLLPLLSFRLVETFNN